MSSSKESLASLIDFSRSNQWEAGPLLAKAQLYIEEANQHNQDDWQFPLFYILALELFARASLAHLSPVLLAARGRGDMEGFNNLLYSLNHGAAPANVASIPATEVFRRCALLIEGFTSDHAKFAEGLAGLRNWELHSGAAPFVELPTDVWLPRFYGSCAALLANMGKGLADCFNDEEATRAQEMIDALATTATKEIEELIATCRTTWDSYDAGERATRTQVAAAAARRSLGHVVKCPCCGSPALLTGNPIGPSITSTEEQELFTQQRMLPSAFSCEACGLQIREYARLKAAGLGAVFTWTTTEDPIDFFGIELGGDDDFNC